MTLSIALVLIFILYLVDKNKIWRPAAKVVIGLVVLGVLGVGGFFAWVKYNDWRMVKAAQKAQQEHEKLVDACVAREAAAVTPPAGYSLERETSESNPDYDWSQWKVVSQTPASFDPNKSYNNLIEIHGGETLKIVDLPPVPGGLNSGMVPILYLGRHQTFVMACGNFGEAKVPKSFPRIEKGNTVCQ